MRICMDELCSLENIYVDDDDDETVALANTQFA